MIVRVCLCICVHTTRYENLTTSVNLSVSWLASSVHYVLLNVHVHLNVHFIYTTRVDTGLIVKVATSTFLIL